MKKINYSYLQAVLYFVLLIGILGFVSCRRDCNVPDDNEDQGFLGLNINPDFKFESTKMVDVSLKVLSNNSQEFPHRFSLYLGNPSQSGRLFDGGFTDSNLRFEKKVKIPSIYDEIYIEHKDVYGGSEIIVIAIDNNTVSYDFIDSPSKTSKLKTTYENVSCDECDEILSGSTGTLLLEEGKKYCVLQGTTYEANEISFKNNTTIVVCGTLKFNNAYGVAAGSKVVINTTGICNIKSGINAAIDAVYNYGMLEFSGEFNLNYSLYNFGEINVGSGLAVHNKEGHTRYNYGKIIANRFNNNDKFENDGEIILTTEFNNNSSGHLINTCKVTVGTNFNHSNLLENDGYISVANEANMNSGIVKFSAGGYMKTDRLNLNTTVEGPSLGCARFDIENTTNILSKTKITGFIDLCDKGGFESMAIILPETVTYCECYIPSTSCNPGAGEPSYDDDTTIVYYPAKDMFTSLAFEDLWPNFGDYDFNDLVVAINYAMYQNAQNECFKIEAKYHIKCVGASMNNGFGIVLNTPPANIKAVEGIIKTGSVAHMYNANNVEQGSLDKSIIIMYDAINDYLGASMINTIPGGPTMEIDTITVTISFENPVVDFGIAPFNPFMIVDQVRGKEVHLIDHNPTELFDFAWLGQQNDDSNPAINRYFISPENLPWAIEIPTDFEYPVEYCDITNAYLKLREWAESSGTLYLDWYQNKPGYRNTSNIYPGN